MSTLHDIAELLTNIKASGSFAARRTASADDLHLEVKGVGGITWPISTATARRLCATARPARYGLKDQTRLDPRVRDTFEIPKTRIRIDQRKWRNTFRPMLDQIRRDLGFPEGARLRAELHNMLVYGPGQFFVTHQDSEKGDDMIGTVVVILPSAFTGGAMVVEHHDERLTLRAAGGKLTLSVEDDGVGFGEDPHASEAGSSGLGLIGIRERASQLQGSIRIESAPGHGTSVIVELPAPVQPDHWGNKVDTGGLRAAAAGGRLG